MYRLPAWHRAAVAAAALLACVAPSVAHASPNPLAGLAYRPIGPAIAGGRATAIAASDRDPRIVYAGGATGGVFKSTDGGTSWNAVFDREAVASIGAIAVSPRDPNDVWVGTGEANPRNEVEEGAGVWHSTNGGKTWQHVGLDDSGTIANISISPRDPRDVVVGVLGHLFRDSTMRGVYTTRDGGAHWTRSLYVGPSVGVSDLRRVPDHPRTLFAGMWRFRRTPWTFTSGGAGDGLYRSDDDGATWHQVSGRGFPSGPIGRVGVAPATGGRVYAIAETRSGDLWRSDDGGTSWKEMPHNPLVGARPFYFTHVFVDPANRDRLIDVGLILSRSTDGGRSFHAIAKNAGWDYHQVWWSQDGNHVLIASDEGVVSSADGGTHFSQSYTLPFAQPYHLGLDDALPYYHVCIGLQDNNSWCAPSSSDNGIGVLNRDWTQVAPGDGMWSVFDPKDPNLVWSTSRNNDNGQVYLTDVRTRQAVEVSPDFEINGLNAPAGLNYRFNWDNPIAFTVDGTALAAGNVVFSSADHGKTWKPISPDLTRNDKARQQRAGGPVAHDGSGAETYATILDVETTSLDAALIWVSTDDGLVQLTRDGGGHWTNVTPPALPADSRVPTIEPGHAAAGTAYAVADRHMVGDVAPYAFATDDYGKTWRSIASNLPRDLTLRTIREDPADASVLYAGTSRGVWASFDRGAHWKSLRLNMPATPVYDLAIQPRADDLVVAAHGRGVWILDDLRAVRAWGHGTNGLTLVQPRDAYRAYQATPINVFTDGTLPSNAFVGRNASYGATIDYVLPAPARNVAITIVDAQGHVVRHLTTKKANRTAGLQRVDWDLTEDGPTRWKRTYEENRGPKNGAEVVPGTYTVRLTVDGQTREQQLVVKADPRDPLTPADWQRRHDALAQLNTELSNVDTWLNTIDARSTPGRLAFRARLTYDPRNVEDLTGVAQLRERILDQISRLSPSAYAPPNDVQTREIAEIKTAYDAMATEYKKL